MINAVNQLVIEVKVFTPQKLSDSPAAKPPTFGREFSDVYR